MQTFSGFLTFRIDPSLTQENRKSLDALLSHFKDAPISDEVNSLTLAPGRLTVDFISENSLHLIKASPSFKICLLDKTRACLALDKILKALWWMQCWTIRWIFCKLKN